ncbi:hypothetical protein AAG570_011622 [Ranatra chinensis]|uniref:Acyl-coenzyme A thioesterase 13 n=1 Tax=Ranatra chinensis TaxID=642074 RepID=A0ABD0YXE5_9HEMI
MCKAEMMVQEEHTNNFGTLHGGMTTSLVDIVSTIALSTHKIAALGVSVDLHIEFLKAAPLGSEVVIEAKTTKAGRTLAFLEVLLTDKSTGDIIAQGSHIKFVGKG